MFIRDARTKELLKVFTIDGQVEARVEALSSPVHEPQPNVEEEMKIKFMAGSTSKKEKTNNFFQRSRNALIGAAGAVCRCVFKVLNL
jgi:hypothetical protein